MSATEDRDRNIREHIKNSAIVWHRFLHTTPCGASSKEYRLWGGDFREGFEQAIDETRRDEVSMGFIDGYIEGLAFLEYLRRKCNENGYIGSIEPRSIEWSRIENDVSMMLRHETLNANLNRIMADAAAKYPAEKKEHKTVENPSSHESIHGFGGINGDCWDD